MFWRPWINIRHVYRNCLGALRQTSGTYMQTVLAPCDKHQASICKLFWHPKIKHQARICKLFWCPFINIRHVYANCFGALSYTSGTYMQTVLVPFHKHQARTCKLFWRPKINIRHVYANCFGASDAGPSSSLAP